MTRVVAFNNVPNSNALRDGGVDAISANSPAVTMPTGFKGFPPQHTMATAAVAGELSATKVKESFNVNNVDKVTKPNETKNITKLGQIGAMFVEPVPTLNPASVVTPVFRGDFKKLNQNPVLSFMRGKLAQNMPLHNDAIAVPNGFLGRELNVIG